MNKINLIFGLLLCSLAALSQGYKDVFVLKDHNNEHLTEFYSYWLQPFSGDESPAVADSAYRSGAFARWKGHKSLSLGDARKRLWLRVVVKNSSTDHKLFVWSVHDFLDTASLYGSSDSGFQKLVSETYWTIASKRIFPARPLCLPFRLNYGEEKTLYLAIDQHNNNLYFPLKIRNPVDFLKEEQNFVIDEYWVWLIGCYVFSIVFNLILFGFLRDKIYLWYCLYVVFNTIFLLMEDSLDGLILPQAAYNVIWHGGQYTFLLLSTATGIRIMQSFTGQSKSRPRFFKTGNALMILSYAFSAFVFIAENSLSPQGRLAIINAVKSTRDILIFVNLLFILVSLVDGFYRRSRLAYYYAITYSFFFFSCFMFMLNHLGWASINLVEPNILAWGLLLELLTLCVLLTGRFRFVIKESSRLQIRNAELQRTQMQQLLEMQEAERKRIAEDLHDDLGPTIGALQLHISNLPPGLANEPYYQKAIFLAAKAATDIRSISHNLLPKDFTELGLIRVLENRIEELNGLQAIRFRLIVSVEEACLSGIQKIMIYRIINELLSNTIRHSQASESVVQLLINDDELLVMLEDNGIGLDNAVDRKGIGLRNIRSRVGFLKGHLNIDSNTRGTSIIITIPTDRYANEG